MSLKNSFNFVVEENKNLKNLNFNTLYYLYLISQNIYFILLLFCFCFDFVCVINLIFN